MKISIDESFYQKTKHSGLNRLINELKAAGINVTPEKEREKARQIILQHNAIHQPFYVFAYGSLMWNPAIQIVSEQKAVLNGYHRDFCLHQPMGRGTIDNPGLMMGLIEGGYCEAKVIEIAKSDIESETIKLFDREYLTGIYLPKWLDIKVNNQLAKALTFVVKQDHERYFDQLDIEHQSRIIAKASGSMGTNAEYLLNTVEHLRELNIYDEKLEQLYQSVQQQLGSNQ